MPFVLLANQEVIVLGVPHHSLHFVSNASLDHRVHRLEKVHLIGLLKLSETHRLLPLHLEFGNCATDRY